MHLSTVATTLFGVKCDEIISKTDRDFLPTEAAEVFHANEKQTIAANAPLKFEETVRYQDGLHTYVSVKFPLRDPDGTPYAICDIATDITGRKRMEEELRESEEKLRLILHYAPVGIGINDLEGRLRDVPPSAPFVPRAHAGTESRRFTAARKMTRLTG